MVNKILSLIEQAGFLIQSPRSHKTFLGNTDDNIASHSHHAAIIAYCLAKMEGLNSADCQKCVTMAVFHDLAEARTGDFGFVAKHYGETDEDRAITDQFYGLPFQDEMIDLLKESKDKKTMIAKCCKDADSLQQIYTEWYLAWQGNKMAKRWFDSDFNDRVPGLETESAKKLALAMKDGDPQDWWWNEFLENETAKDLSKLLGK